MIIPQDFRISQGPSPGPERSDNEFTSPAAVMSHGICAESGYNGIENFNSPEIVRGITIYILSPDILSE